MKQNPITTATGFAKFENIDVELAGETYDTPVMSTDDKHFYSIIKLFDVETGLPFGVQFLAFEQQLTEEDYKNHFDFIKAHIGNYSKKAL